MADDVIISAGSSKASKSTAGKANIRDVPVLGIVKNNVDPIRSGRIQVYISDFGSLDPDDSEGWTTVSYLSPFYGFVEPKAGDTGYGDYTSNPSSYGFWNSPPDIGTTVVCLFVNGDSNYGYYIGCVPKPEALHMVPAIGSSEKIIANNEGEANGYGGATRLPVTNINTNNDSISDNQEFLNAPKPIHSYSAMIMNQQGIIRDPIRGPISSSAQRESPSRVGWGVSTPGRPIYDGGHTDSDILEASKTSTPESLRVIARRGGHSIVMDDGDLVGRDQLVRIRSAAGHQILMSDDGQTLFIIHSNGQSYIELGKEGTIDMYSTNSVNIRTQGDLNLHADNDVNIHAAKKFNLRAESINLQSEKDTNHVVGANYSVDTTGTFTHKVGGPMSMQSSGAASYASSGVTFINGSKINLNTGSTSTTPKTVPQIQLKAHTDTLYDSQKGYAAAPAKLQSVTSRAPAHAPWANAGQGVDVKTSLDAGSSLPSSPTPKTNAANNNAAATPVQDPVSLANVSTVPPVPSTSNAIDKATTSAMVAASAQNAVSGATAAVAKGAATIQTSTGPSVNLGLLAQTPRMLESAGVLKPGSASLITSLTSAGVSIAKAMPTNLFTGAQGISSLPSFINNVPSQVNAQVSAFQRSQTGLMQAGVITGRESPSAMAGLVMSGANAGITNTLKVVKDVASAAAMAGVPNARAIAGVASNVSKLINSGNFAAGTAQSVLSGASAVVGALGALSALGKPGSDLRKLGASAAAFQSILSQYKALQVGIPQNLKEIANATTAASQRASSPRVAGTSLPGITPATIGGAIAGAMGVASAVNSLGRATSTASQLGAISSVLGAVGRVSGTIVPGSNTILSGAQSVLGAASQLSRVNGSTSPQTILNATNRIISGVSGIVNGMSSASRASGITNLPGGASLLGAISNPSLSSQIPGVSAAVQNSLSAATNGISLPQSISSAAGAIGGTASAALSKLTGTLSSLGGSKSLSSLPAGLDPSIAAQLTSAMSSVSSASGGGIVMPTIGLETYSRAAVEAQSSALLGDSRIPRPNFSGNPLSDEKVKVFEATKAELDSVIEESFTQRKIVGDARLAWKEAQQNLPAGDAQIAALHQIYNEENAKAIAIEKKIADLRQQQFRNAT